MKRHIWICLSFYLVHISQVIAQDKFAEIGIRNYTSRANLLTVPQPSILPEITAK